MSIDHLRFSKAEQSTILSLRRFIAQLTSDPSAKYATFSVVETNTFRNITHISLQFIPGADTAIKQYLAQLVKDYKVCSLAPL